MSMQFNGSVHADGWWDHMPVGHAHNVLMNDGAVDSEAFTARRDHPHKRQRSHAAAWVLFFIVAAGGLGMAAARQLDPAGFDARLDLVVANAHELGDKISDQFDNKEPAVSMDATALGDAPRMGSAPSATTTAMAAPNPAPASTPPQPTPRGPVAPQP